MVRRRWRRGWRPAIASDVCILLPSRTSLSALEAALTAVGVPYRAETSSLVYASREIREVLLALAAIADPTDELATVAALRSFVYGCGDDDLAHWRLGVRGRFTLRAPIPEEHESHPVASACSISSSSTRPVSGRPRPNFSIDSYASEACSRPRSPAQPAMCGGGCAS